LIRIFIGFSVLLGFIEPVVAGSYRTTATHYSDYYNGRRMANGRKFVQNSNYVAHPWIRLGTPVTIRYKNRSVSGIVTDRCNCTIDLSKGLFRQLAPLKKGRIPVKVSY
jgi:rare lipoprotein A (peptidoglycan hydrolase)